jgi:hypothetical protein
MATVYISHCISDPQCVPRGTFFDARSKGLINIFRGENEKNINKTFAKGFKKVSMAQFVARFICILLP